MANFLLNTAWIYILTNKHRTTLYVGVTTDIKTRIWEHRTKQNPNSFTSRYNLHILVYFEGFLTLTEGIERENFIKGKTRSWKNDLISKSNPDWSELSPPD